MNNEVDWKFIETYKDTIAALEARIKELQEGDSMMCASYRTACEKIAELEETLAECQVLIGDDAINFLNKLKENETKRCLPRPTPKLKKLESRLKSIAKGDTK